MRVAIVCTELAPFTGGGIAASVRATAQVLAGAGHHVDLFTRRSFRDRAARMLDSSPVFRHPRIQWHWVAEPVDDATDWHVQMSERFDAALRNAYRRSQPDLVEIHDYQGLGAHVAANRAGGVLGDTIVANRLHSSLEQVAYLDATPNNDLISALERVSLIASDVLLAPSEAVFDFYRSFYSALELPSAKVVRPGFLFDDAPSLMPARTPSDDLELLLIGRQQRFKGTDRIVRALVECPELPIRLTLLGADTPSGPTGSMRDYVRHLAANDPRISIAGPVPRAEIAGFLRRADAVLIPSVWETWGNVGLEALAAGRPLIVTPSASLPEMAGHGRYGLVAEGYEVADLQHVLRRAVEDRDRLLSLVGDVALPQHLIEMVDESRIVAGYSDLTKLEQGGARRSFEEWRGLIDEAEAAYRAGPEARAEAPEISAELQKTFSTIYAEETWTDALLAMPRSGRGSLPEYSATVINHLRGLITSGKVSSIADVGCGDLAYIKEIPEIRRGDVHYLGLDIVPSLILEHQALGWGTFDVADIAAPGFRVDADVIVVKDVLFHLSNEQVHQALENLRASRFDELLITSIDGADNFARAFDRWHYAPLDLTAPPFRLPATRSLPRADGRVLILSQQSLADGRDEAASDSSRS